MAHASRGSPNSRGSRPPGSPESNDSMSETRLSGLGQGTREARSSSLGILRQEDRRTGGQEDRRTGGQEDRRTGGQERGVEVGGLRGGSYSVPLQFMASTLMVVGSESVEKGSKIR